MTRVLMVYHDTNVADLEADELRRAGYEVDRCAGPIGGGPCPVLHGEACWQVEAADVLLYDRWDAMHGGPVLVDELRLLHGGKPLVVTSSAYRSQDSEQPGDPIVALSRADLADAIESALRAPRASTAKVREAHRDVAAYHGPSW